MINEDGILYGLSYIINYIKDIFLQLLYNKGILSRKEARLEEIKYEYESLVQDYDIYKQDPKGNQDMIEDLKQRALNLKNSIDEYNSTSGEELERTNSDYVQSVVSSPTTPSNQPETISSPVPVNSINVGDVTSSIDDMSQKCWNQYWSKYCKGSLSGKELGRCKAKGVDVAVNLIRRNLYLCKKTNDPSGCFNTITNLLNVWKQRKLDYLRS